MPQQAVSPFDYSGVFAVRLLIIVTFIQTKKLTIFSRKDEREKFYAKYENAKYGMTGYLNQAPSSPILEIGHHEQKLKIIL